MKLAYRRKLTGDELKAWSQNLGHERMLTTFLNYGEVPSDRQAEIFRSLSEPNEPASEVDEIAREFAIFMRQRRRPEANRDEMAAQREKEDRRSS